MVYKTTIVNYVVDEGLVDEYEVGTCIAINYIVPNYTD